MCSVFSDCFSCCISRFEDVLFSFCVVFVSVSDFVYLFLLILFMEVKYGVFRKEGLCVSRGYLFLLKNSPEKRDYVFLENIYSF